MGDFLMTFYGILHTLLFYGKKIILWHTAQTFL